MESNNESNIPTNVEQETESVTTNEKAETESSKSDVIMIRMWPKTPVLYPMAILALICGIVGLFAGSTPELRAINEIYTASEKSVEASEEGTQNIIPVDDQALLTHAKNLSDGLVVDRVMGVLFLLVFAFSLLTLSIDMEVRWAIVTLAFGLVLVLVLILVNQQYDFLPSIFATLLTLSPIANPQFYFSIFVIWVILMAISFGIVRFHYVRVESNEVIVVGGLLERKQRFPTLRMRYTRDIQDVFEYYLPMVRSGRLVLSFSEQQESVVIDNVLNIDKVTARLDKIAGVLHVQERER